MKLLSLFPILLLVTGCMRIATDKQDGVAAQAISDSNAAAIYIYDVSKTQGTKLAADAIRKHSFSIAAAMEIDPRDLPKARVTDNDWKQDAERAAKETDKNVKEDGLSLASVASATVIATLLAGVGLRLGAGLLTTTPFGPILSAVGLLFGHDSQTKRNVHGKILGVLEDYKELDIAWRDNKLYTMLSDRLTSDEKDYIKRSRNAL